MLNKDYSTKEVSTTEYLKWLSTNSHEGSIKTVGKDNIIRLGMEDILISTVFLGINHSMESSNVNPILFETMVFEGKYDQEMWRYCTYEEAVKGHIKVVKMCGGKTKLKVEIIEPIVSRFDILDL